MNQPIPIIPANNNWRKHEINPCNEEMVELEPIPNRLLLYPYYAKQGIPYSSEKMHCRKSLAERLDHASSLLPSGYSLVIMDAWRSYEVQNELYQMWKSHLAGVNRDISGDELEVLTQKYVSLPSRNTSAPAPHATGGSVDVMLMRNDLFLPMGTDFDDMSPKAGIRYYEELQESGRELSPKQFEALQNRRMLYAVMIEAGFVAYAEEWWHFDYGNQWWGLQVGRPALYEGVWEID